MSLRKQGAPAARTVERQYTLAFMCALAHIVRESRGRTGGAQPLLNRTSGCAARAQNTDLVRPWEEPEVKC